jgi:PD-(D/E)XK endonuclease
VDNTITRGNAAEAAVLAALAASEIPALLPFGHGFAFDIGALVPPNGELVRVQVKSGRVRRGCVVFNACSTDHGSGRQDYRGRADYIAVHVPELASLYVLPVDDCPSFAGRLRLDPPRNNQRRGIRFACDYEFDRWVWRLMRRDGLLAVS